MLLLAALLLVISWRTCQLRACLHAWQEYYRAIQGALAVLPAFASPVYLTRKASSSVAAAVICGTPLLADAALLQAYSYLPPRAVFETTADERLAVAVSRIAAHSSEVCIALTGPGCPRQDAIQACSRKWQADCAA